MAFIKCQYTNDYLLTIHMHWENGRSLAIVPGVDSFHRVDGPAKEVPKSEKAKKERSLQR